MLDKTLLIADDDRDLAELLAVRARTLGLGVDIAHDAMSAMRKIEQYQPDVVILDVNMPAGNGLSVCEMMSRHEKLCTIPVIILTGQKDQETVRRCHNLCAYYVPKCPDLWQRIQPLLTELLELLAMPLAEQPTPPSDNPTENPTAGPTDNPADLPADADSQNSLPMIDRVFALCGWNDDYLLDDPIDQPTRTVTRPWVLCIDDDSDFSFTLKMRLEQHGVEVLRAFAGMEGYRYAFTGQAQAIVLDYELPNGNGDYVLRRLKENPVTQDIPVIILTGRKEKSLERKMYALGASGFITKPYDWTQLWAELQKHLPASVPASL